MSTVSEPKAECPSTCLPFRIYLTMEISEAWFSAPNAVSENPDDGSYCWKCGSVLYTAPMDVDMTTSDIPNLSSSPVTGSEIPDENGRVVLEKTPERIRNRRLCQFMSVVTMLFIIGFTFKIDLSMTESVAGYVIDRESESMLEIAGMSPYGIWIAVFLVLTLIAALLAIVSPRLALISVPTLVVAFILSYQPFQTTGPYGLMLDYAPDDYTNVVMFILVLVIIVALEVLAEVFLCKSVNKDGRVIDRDTILRRRGLTYNIDSEWNVVDVVTHR